MAEILVPLTDTAGDEGAVDFAAQRARPDGGHLTIIQPADLPLPSLGPRGDGPISQMQASAMAAIGSASQKAWAIRHKLAALDVPHLVEVEDGRTEAPLRAIARRARIFDYSVMACAGASASERKYQHSIFSALIFESGRPVFAIPDTSFRSETIRRAMVAWKSTRESARAAHDFLQLGLQCDVVVVTISEPPDPDDSGGHFVENLLRRGRSGSFSSVPQKEGSVADTLLSHAVEIGADLIVSGAYGHSQTREMLLGGTTRHLFDRTHIPAFFSR
jgi:nucleotide-binding universal stress UspA family protein